MFDFYNPMNLAHLNELIERLPEDIEAGSAHSGEVRVILQDWLSDQINLVDDVHINALLYGGHTLRSGGPFRGYPIYMLHRKSPLITRQQIPQKYLKAYELLPCRS